MHANWTLEADEVLALPVDELAVRVLRDVIANSEWNSHNWLLLAQQVYPATGRTWCVRWRRPGAGCTQRDSLRGHRAGPRATRSLSRLTDLELGATVSRPARASGSTSTCTRVWCRRCDGSS